MQIHLCPQWKAQIVHNFLEISEVQHLAIVFLELLSIFEDFGIRVGNNKRCKMR